MKLRNLPFLGIILCTVLLQTACISRGDKQIPALLLTIPLIHIYLLSSSDFKISITHLSLYLLFTLLALFQIALIPNCSPLSAFNGLLLYSIFIYQPKTTRIDVKFLASCYIYIHIGVALICIYQYISQLFGNSPIAITDYVPTQYLLDGFNYGNEIKFGIQVIRSNGLFYLEPSICSQALATAIVFEFALKKRTPVIAILSVALILTFSGTGIALLLFCILIQLVKERSKALWYVIPIIATLIATYISDYGDYFQYRMDEFGREGTSAHIRFQAPFTIAYNLSLESPTSFFLGHGPGFVSSFSSDYPALYSVIPKVCIEYGIPGFLIVILLVFLKRNTSNIWTIPWLLSYFILNGSFLMGFVVIPMFAFITSASTHTTQSIE